MPALSLDLILEALLPWLSAEGRAALRAIVAAGGRIRADALARHLGLSSRFQLVRLLRREGLPPFGPLTDWISILSVTLEAEATGRALFSLAQAHRLEPATCYRRFRRATGVSWRQARARGLGWLLLKFRDRCSRPSLMPSLRAQRGASSAFERHAPAVVGLGRRGPRLHRDPALDARLARRGHPEGRIVASVPLTDGAFDVAIARTGHALLTRPATATVERLHLRTLRFESPIRVGANPTRITMGPQGVGYVTNQFSDSVSVIEPAAAEVVGTFGLVGDPAPVAVSPDAQTLFVTTNADRLYSIKIDSGRIDAALNLPATSHHLAHHPSRPWLYVATRNAGTVLEIDTATMTRRREFVLGGRTQGLAIAPDGTELYVANEQGGLDVVDLATGGLVASLELGGPAFMVAATPDRTQLYVGLVNAERVQVVDRSTLRAVGTIATGGVPRGIAFDPRTQSALIANEAGWLTVVA